MGIWYFSWKKSTQKNFKRGFFYRARENFARQGAPRKARRRRIHIRRAALSRNNAVLQNFIHPLGETKFRKTRHTKKGKAKAYSHTSSRFIEEQRSIAEFYPPAEREKISQDKAHRERQGEGVFTYVEPLYRGATSIAEFYPPAEREKISQDKAHREKQDEGVFTYVEPLYRGATQYCRILSAQN